MPNQQQPGKAQNKPWITKVRIVKTRPALPNQGPANQTQTYLLTQYLGETMRSGGSLRINAADLPISLKSLRTQVVVIAGKLNAYSHVLFNKDTNTIDMWLESKTRTRAQNNSQSQGQKGNYRRAPRQNPKARALFEGVEAPIETPLEV